MRKKYLTVRPALVPRRQNAVLVSVRPREAQVSPSGVPPRHSPSLSALPQPRLAQPEMRQFGGRVPSCGAGLPLSPLRAHPGQCGRPQRVGAIAERCEGVPCPTPASRCAKPWRSPFSLWLRRNRVRGRGVKGHSCSPPPGGLRGRVGVQKYPDQVGAPRLGIWRRLGGPPGHSSWSPNLRPHLGGGVIEAPEAGR